MKIEIVEQQFGDLKKYFQLAKILYKNLNNYCKASNTDLFLFLNEDNPFKSVHYHKNNLISYHGNNLFKISPKIWYPCLKFFELNCPLCEIDEQLITLYYLKGWEYNKNQLTGLSSFKRPVIIQFFNINEILSFVHILKNLGSEINFIIYSFDPIEQKPVLKYPSEETINLALKLLTDFPTQKLYQKLFHPAVITDFSKEGLNRLQFRYNRIKDRILMSEKITKEFKNEE